MGALKRKVVSLLWDEGWSEEEIVKVLRVLAEVKKDREEQKNGQSKRRGIKYPLG